MKNVTSIVVLVFYLASFTEMHQLVRVPILFAHYQEHRSEEGGIGFLDYLSLHYFADSHQDSRHQDLPFKHKTCEILHLVLAVVPGPATEILLPSPCNAQLVSYEPQLPCQSATASIWQPPRHTLM